MQKRKKGRELNRKSILVGVIFLGWGRGGGVGSGGGGKAGGVRGTGGGVWGAGTGGFPNCRGEVRRKVAVEGFPSSGTYYSRGPGTVMEKKQSPLLEIRGKESKKKGGEWQRSFPEKVHSAFGCGAA